jgi:hypothetical protein
MKPTYATAQEEAVIEMLQRTGPCCVDDIVRHLHLSWSEAFVAVDRMSRDRRVLLRQVGYSTYQVTLPAQLAAPRSPVRQEAA